MPAKLNTTIKKKPLNMNAEQQDAVRMQTAERLKQSSQSNKSFDTNRTQANAPVKATPAERLKTSQSDNILSVNNPVESDIPLIKRDPKTKTVTGVSLPNGETFDNISPEEVQKIVDNWNNESAAPANSMFEDVFRKQQTDQQLAKESKASIDEKLSGLKNIDNADIAAQTFADTGQTLDPLTQSIERKNALSSTVEKIPILNLNKFSAPLIKFLNKQTVGTTGAAASLVPGLSDYLSDYSQDDNYELVKQHIGDSKTAIDVAIKLAANPETKEEGFKVYRAALIRLENADRQLKIISKKKNSKDVILSREDIESFKRDILAQKEISFKNAYAGVQ